MSQQGGCGCMPLLILLGGVGYGGYYAYTEWFSSDAPTAEQQPAQAVAVTAPATPEPAEHSWPVYPPVEEEKPVVVVPQEVEPTIYPKPEEAVTVTITPAETEEEPTTEPEIVVQPEPQPEIVAQPEPEPEPVVPQEKAFGSLKGKVLVMDYSAAELASCELDAEEPEELHFAPLPDGYFGDDGRDRICAYKRDEYNVTLAFYERKGDDSAELAILSVAAEPAMPFIKKMQPYLDVMPYSRAVTVLGMYGGDCEETYMLRFDSPTSGTAEYIMEGGCSKTVVRNIRFTVEEEPSAGDNTASVPCEVQAPATLNNVWMKLTHMEGDVWFYCKDGKIYRCNAEIAETDTPPAAPERFRDVSQGSGYMFEDNLKRPYSAAHAVSYKADGATAELFLQVETIKRTFYACYGGEMDYSTDCYTYDGKPMRIKFTNNNNGTISGYCEGVYGMAEFGTPAQTLQLTIYGVDMPAEQTADAGGEVLNVEELNALISNLRAKTYESEYENKLRDRLLILLPRIAAGEDVNTVLENANGTTALHNACGLGELDIVIWLISHGADVTRTTANGATVEQCIGNDPDGVIKMLIQSVQPEPEEAVSAAMIDEIMVFLERLYDMTDLDATQSLYQKRLLTLLPAIASTGDVNLTLPETKGNTALHYACGMGDVELVTWLVQHGADVNRKTDKGKTPFDCAGGDVEAVRAALKSAPSVQPADTAKPVAPKPAASPVGLGSLMCGPSSLEGTFYDLKLKSNGKSTGLKGGAEGQNGVVAALAKCFAFNKWSEKELNKYYKSENCLYLSNFYLPVAYAKHGPLAFQEGDADQPEDKWPCKPSAWVAVYRGKVKAPVTGKFRFIGVADDFMAVRFNGKTVLEAGYRLPSRWTKKNPHAAWVSGESGVATYKKEIASGKDKNHKGYEFITGIDGCQIWDSELGGLTAGASFNVKAGEYYPIEIAIAEIPGGKMGFVLFIEQLDENNKPVREDNGGMYDLFRTDDTLPDPETINQYLKDVGCYAGDAVIPFNPDSLIWEVK